MTTLTTRRASTLQVEARAAVRELKVGIEQPGQNAVILFCSPGYDLVAFGAALRDAFSCPVIACTSAGQIGPTGYQAGGACAVSLASNDLEITQHVIAPLGECRQRALQVGEAIRNRARWRSARRHAFGLLLVDGLSMSEEPLVAALYQSLGEVPLVGGSAGDDLAFRRTAVYWDGEFLSDVAVLSLFETSLPFAPLKLQHFHPSHIKLVTTDVIPAQRLVRELNGLPAADAYAEALGVTRERLDASVWSKHPLMLRIGGDHYLRGIQKVNDDGSMALYCAIEEGLVLTIGEEGDPVETLERGLREATSGIRAPELVIGCDCVQRRLEFQHDGIDGRVGQVLAEHRVIGFSTYGEQYDAVHVNQTFTGIALGS